MNGLDEFGGPLLDMHNSVDRMLPTGLAGEAVVVALSGLVIYAAAHAIYEDFFMSGHRSIWSW